MNQFGDEEATVHFENEQAYKDTLSNEYQQHLDEEGLCPTNDPATCDICFIALEEGIIKEEDSEYD